MWRKETYKRNKEVDSGVDRVCTECDHGTGDYSDT